MVFNNKDDAVKYIDSIRAKNSERIDHGEVFPCQVEGIRQLSPELEIASYYLPEGAKEYEVVDDVESYYAGRSGWLDYTEIKYSDNVKVIKYYENEEDFMNEIFRIRILIDEIIEGSSHGCPLT